MHRAVGGRVYRTGCKVGGEKEERYEEGDIRAPLYQLPGRNFLIT